MGKKGLISTAYSPSQREAEAGTEAETTQECLLPFYSSACFKNKQTKKDFISMGYTTQWNGTSDLNQENPLTYLPTGQGDGGIFPGEIFPT